MHRRGGRTAWLPAFLLWLPLVLVGIYLVTSMSLHVDPVGDQDRVRMELPGPAHWLDDPVWFGIGCAVLVLGLVFLGLSRWEPAPGRLPGVVAVYPWFQAAGLFLVAAFVMALLVRDGDALDVSAGAVQWRFLLDVRGGLWNRVTAGLVGAVALAVIVAGIGRARILEPSAPAPDAVAA